MAAIGLEREAFRLAGEFSEQKVRMRERERERVTEKSKQSRRRKLDYLLVSFLILFLIIVPPHSRIIAALIRLKDFYRFELDEEVLSKRLASKTTEKDILEYTKVRQRQWPWAAVTMAV